jgi:23S rRNA (uracil1939-C5)-methyltransferase
MDPGLDSSERVVDVERLVTGGDGLAHEPTGRVVMVAGALPGERVRIRLLDERPRMSTAAVAEVLEPSPVRVAPPCLASARGCGGCDLQYAAPEAQPALKADIVRDALVRAVRGGRLPEIPVVAGEALSPWGYRTTVRCAVDGDRLGFRERRSDAALAVGDCPVAHELVAEVIRAGRFPGAEEVTVRAGVRTGDRLAVVTRSVAADREGGDGSFDAADGADGRSGVTVPDGVRVVGVDELRAGRRAWIHEEVAGHRFRISALSFFQSGPAAAEALVAAVARALGPLDPADRLVDLYGGVGLFAVALGTDRPVLVERSASSVADARVNLADRDATVVRTAVERWRPSKADVVVADPARAGLGRAGVAAVAATGAPRAALVSCDVASLVRDLELLAAAGYRATGIEVVDVFPNTHHVEAVTALERG